MTVLLSTVLHSARIRRLSALADFLRAMQHAQAQEELERQALLDAASQLPEPIRKVLADEPLLSALFEYGQYSARFYHGPGSDYGFKDKDDVCQQFDALRAA